MFTESFEKTATTPLAWASMPILFDAIYTGSQNEGDELDKIKSAGKSLLATLAGAGVGMGLGAGAGIGLAKYMSRGHGGKKLLQRRLREMGQLGAEVGGTLGGIIGAHEGYDWALK